MRRARFGAGIERGVWVTPWTAERGETILVAVRRDGRRICERLLGPGDDHVGTSEEMWELLERDDPMPRLQVI